MIYRLPSPEDDPTPPAPTAGLIMLDCEACQGDGWVETPETGYRCAACGGSGYSPELCGGCLEAPTVDGQGYEACGCSDASEVTAYLTCECCERRVLETEMHEGLCSNCFGQGLERVEADEDPEYARWLEHEMAFAHAVGWL